MKYFCLDLEVAGGIGGNTIMDKTSHPPTVSKLHYVFDVWLGDELLEGFPCFIITESGMKTLQEANVTGVKFGPVEITASDEFQDFYPGRNLPGFVWMQVDGSPKHDDFSIGSDFRLVVSERALQLLREIGISHAKISEL